MKMARWLPLWAVIAAGAVSLATAFTHGGMALGARSGALRASLLCRGAGGAARSSFLGHRDGATADRRAGRSGMGTLGLRAQEEDGELRAGRDADAETIKEMVLEEKMNPLFLSPENFVIAEQDGEIFGIGQIRPIDKSWELASLVVKEEARGNGIGTAIVQELLELHQKKFEAEGKGVPPVLALTLKETKPFYTRMGWLEQPMSMAPMKMQAEASVGGVVAALTGNSLICVKYKFPSVELDSEQSGTIIKNVNET